MKRAILGLMVSAVGCTGPDEPVVIDLAAALDGAREATVTRRFEVDGVRPVTVVAGDEAIVVEMWAEGGAVAGAPAEQLAAGAAASWRVPRPERGDLGIEVEGRGGIELTVWARGTPAPAVIRERALTWVDAALLDDPATISLWRVMWAIGDDGGGVLFDRWFRAFAAGPGAGRAAFAQFLDEIAAAQGDQPSAWDLTALPFRVTGVHARHDLGRGTDCGELRVSIASTHPTFAPVHLIFLFRQPAAADDVTPDGHVHCRGAARRWARLGALDDASWRAAARAILDQGITRDRFVMAESVELTISPWQWRQWAPDGAGALVNPPLFQTVDVARVNAPGPTRDAFLAAVAAAPAAIDAQRWEVPVAFRAPVIEVQPNAQAALVDLSPLSEVLTTYPALPRAIGMIGCPRCHTDSADFVQTGLDRRPSPFYDRELDARAARLDALGRGEWPTSPPFGPLQSR